MSELGSGNESVDRLLTLRNALIRAGVDREESTDKDFEELSGALDGVARGLQAKDPPVPAGIAELEAERDRALARVKELEGHYESRIKVERLCQLRRQELLAAFKGVTISSLHRDDCFLIVQDQGPCDCDAVERLDIARQALAEEQS